MTEPAPHRTSAAVEIAKSPVTVALAAALVIYMLAYLFLGLAKDHRSALEICAEAGGTYNSLTKVCSMPGVDDRSVD